MQFTLLRAKLHRPVLPLAAIPRPRLLRHLQAGIHGKITLVSAPAGFGKSTIVGAWLNELEAQSPGSAEQTGCAVGWLSLEEADNQLPRFVRYLVAAIESLFPECCASVVAMLAEQPPPTVEELADLLANTLISLPDRLLLVLDDLHTIDDAAIHAFLVRLVQHTSHQLHLVLITRVDPPLPLSRWRASGQMNELRLHDLSFTVEDTEAFLKKSLGESLPDALVTTLYERTEGWVVGLRLAALALRGQTNYDAFMANMQVTDPANNRYVIDYLIDDVLDHQPPPVQKFLICTALLNRFCNGLCAAIMGTDEVDAQGYIEYVDRTNLFLIELSSPPQWYRYHHQFQSMLLSRLYERYDEQAIAQLHRHAATWLAAHEQIDEALRHLAAIPDFVAAAEMLEEQRLVALNELRFDELETWLATLPAPLLEQRPFSLLSLAWVQFDQMDKKPCLETADRAAALLREKAATLPTATQQLLEAELIALRTALDTVPNNGKALDLIRQSWQWLCPHLMHSHCNVPLWLAYTAQRLGDLELALTIVLTTLERTASWPPLGRGRLLHTAGFFYWCAGNLMEAERTFLQNLRLAQQHHLPLIATISQHGLGGVADARNQLDAAEKYHKAVVQNPHLTNGRDAVMDMYSLIGIYARRGQPEEALSLIEEIKEHAQVVSRPYLLNQVAALEAYAALHCGDRTTAMRWALTGSLDEMYNGADRIPVIRARILLAEGSPASLSEAAQLLQELICRHQSENAWHRLTEVLILQALTQVRLENNQLALDALGRAVQIAVPKGMVGPFIEQGPPIKQLLLALSKQPDHTQSARLLLAAFAPDINATLATPMVALVEPLTEREIDVLRLLGDRLTTKEIAQKLIVSPHTVRNHLANIFDKLQVDNRVQAAERARELGLLPPARIGSSLEGSINQN